MTVYFNEFDPYAAQWLRNLISAGHLPAGDVDERSIRDVAADDLAGYSQCHFFAGIGGWALACRIAGWPDTREIWTGSPPCQPFSVAGQGKAQADDRHLWPDLFRLIRGRRPADFVGEQVAAAVGHGWLDGVLSDLESICYSCGAVVAPACAIDGPHRRDRLWIAARSRAVGDGQRAGLEGHARHVDDGAGWPHALGSVAEAGSCCALADADGTGSLARFRDDQAAGHGHTASSASDASPWARHQWIIGHDGKARRIPVAESGIRLLATGVSARVGRLRAYGNAIVPTLGAQVIASLMECAP